ncbi:BfmA/BtgA family mobilization protein [Hwangdonia lutea]|uniref:BfmA/BtgA family mobilization protein n=1 Tax=Hwangdonia lutea TaxID=3075823 RepID=A0AA97HQY8_9FLAO|nr:BfmA/BtgA family mobilization protein [Hwangdonia sp. SCSIO 19198]WOD42888.1 BfmA/BtgA family mobilization protein [Hwangdonia sp. SCSIO 19198]
MDKGYEKERFENLSIKRSVVKKFRKYSKSISKSNSMTLLSMVEFFENNELSPDDDLKSDLIETENRIKKRINTLIAILKDIEKNQTKPTLGMLQAIFMNVEPKPKILIEKSFEELERERINKEFKLKFRGRNEFQFKKDNKDLNNRE